MASSSSAAAAESSLLRHEEYGDEGEKKNLNLIVIGHVDAGKSTTTGHLMVKCGGIDKRVLAKLEADAKAMGKGSFKFAWALDKLQSERERGVTIDISHNRFETDSCVFNIIDAPGHRDFLKNMIMGASQADAALLMVSCVAGEFEAGFSKDGQTKEHALLAYSFGVRQLIVCCNKMDSPNVAYSKARFEEVRTEVAMFVSKLGFDKDSVPIIPMSGWNGDNIIERATETMPWYEGPTLVGALDKLAPPPRPTSRPLRIPLLDIYRIGGIGTVAVGRVETGVLRPGDEVSFAPCNTKASANASANAAAATALVGTVGIIELHNKQLKEATPGMHIGFSIKGVQLSDLRRGYVCGLAKSDPPREALSFTAQIIILNGEGSISVGYTPMLDCHTAHVPCKIEAIEARIDRRTGKVIEEHPRTIRVNDAAIVRLVPMKPLVVEAFSDYPPLGRFAMRDHKHTIGIGIVKAVMKRGA